MITIIGGTYKTGKTGLAMSVARMSKYKNVLVVTTEMSPEEALRKAYRFDATYMYAKTVEDLCAIDDCSYDVDLVVLDLPELVFRGSVRHRVTELLDFMQDSDHTHYDMVITANDLVAKDPNMMAYATDVYLLERPVPYPESQTVTVTLHKHKHQKSVLGLEGTFNPSDLYIDDEQFRVLATSYARSYFS